MKLTVETSKEVEIELPEYPFYIKIINGKSPFFQNTYGWVKNSASITICGYNQIYNDDPKTVFTNMLKENKVFEVITKVEFEVQVKETIDTLTLIPF